MVKTRAMAELEDKFQKLFAFMQEMKQGQEEMKQKMEQGQEEMKLSQVEMKQSQEEMKQKMEQGQEEMKQEIKQSQEEMKQSQEEMKVNIVNVINTKVDAITEKVETLEKKNTEKFEIIDQKFESIEGKFERLELEMARKVKEELNKIYIMPEVANEDAAENKSQEMRVPESATPMPVIAKTCIKLSTYDGKTSWQVYKTQFSIVAEANGWDLITKARQLAASLRAEAADILRTLPEHQQLNFEALSNALELRFGEKCLKDYSRLQLKSRQQKPNESLQELATDIERLSHLAYSDCPSEVRETLSLQYFVDGVRDMEIQKSLRMAEIKDLKSALVYAMKFEAAQQASRRHLIRGAEIQHYPDTAFTKMTKTLDAIHDMMLKQGAPSNKHDQRKAAKCWRCGAEGHIQRNCQARQDQRVGDAPKSKQQEN